MADNLMTNRKILKLSYKLNELFESIEDNNLEKYKEILAENPNLINAALNFEQSAFWFACFAGRIEMVKFALEDSAIGEVVRPYKPDQFWRNPVDAAQAMNCKELVDLFEAHLIREP